MRSWDDIDDLTDIYINQVVYPDENEFDEEGGGSDGGYKVIEMPRSIFVTQVWN